MEDFGKILDKWDSKRGNPADEVVEGMAEWINRYPPEIKEDDSTSAIHHSRRRNPLKMKAEDSLDLHGYRLEEALEVTDRFIEESVQSGYRKVVIVHGKGENGQGVLRREVRAHLERHPMTGTMGYNRGPDGGRGALWVILREKRDDSEPPRA